ncbi:MAG: DegT/DnrJ/EryC1/StrS family aminotransferase [Spirochaetales bacterium]|nr:DegT/DnrJ/EryC1/StrS family aminotransferase [Spirochaetales bacterium]
MQFIDLMAQQQQIKNKLMENITAVLDHGKYINGPEVKQLEETLAAFTGTKHAIGCASGTDALLMTLMAYGVGAGDAVFTSPFTFIATAEVISLLGAIPVFVDIHEDTFNIDPQKLEQAVAKVKKQGRLRLKGIIPVDLFGQPADYDEIKVIAEKNNLFVLEDAAQSFGAVYKGKRSCSLADAAATSFFPAKPLGCYGDGGMIFTDDEELSRRLVSIRVHGKGQDKYDNVRIGLNGRLDTLQAAVLLAKFTTFETELQKRQEVSKRYSEALQGICRTPYVKEHNLSAWAQYSIIHEERDAIAGHLKGKNIPTAVYYPKPLHLQQAFAHLDYHEGDFPVCERLCGQVLSLPMHPYLDSETQAEVINAVRQALT